MTFVPEHFAVWMEIPVTDLDAGVRFYEAVTGGALDRHEMGGQPTAIFRTQEFGKGIAGHLYQGTPAREGNGPTVHILCDGKLEDSMARAEKAGGTLVRGPVEIPAGRFSYVKDPDGNSIGLFEPCAA